MKIEVIIEIIEEGIKNNKTPEEIARMIAIKINDNWYPSRKCIYEDIIDEDWEE